MFRELAESRGIIWRLIVRDVTALYKQSILGVLWAFLSPLVMMIIFLWVKQNRILNIADTVIPYAAFVFLGQLLWQFFSSGLTVSANSLVKSSPLLTKINFPREALVFSAVGQAIFEFVIRVPLLLIIFVVGWIDLYT